MKGLKVYLTGNVDITDPFNHTYARFSGTAEYFRFSNDSVGKIYLTADYNKQSGIVNGTVNSDNKDYHFDLKGIFNTSDSAKTANQYHDSKHGKYQN